MVSAVPQRQYGPAYDILIVDNKELTRDMVQKILQQEGYTVDTARHGKEAIEKLRASQYGYRLIITEMIMPYAGGFEVIKTTKRESRIPVLVLSAVADEGTISEAFRLNADDFLKKPFMASELVQRIQRLLVRYSVPVYPGKPAVEIAPVRQAPEYAAPVAMPADAAVQKRAGQIREVSSTVKSDTAAARKTQAAGKTAPAAKTATRVKKAAAAPATAKPATRKTAGAKAAETTAKPKRTTAKVTAGSTPVKKKTAPAAPKKKAPAKKTVTVKKTTTVKKTALAPKKKAGRAKNVRPAGTKSKIIIRNSIPMIRLITPAAADQYIGNRRQHLNVDKTAPWYCAVAV